MSLAVRRGSAWDPFSSLVRQFDSDFDQIVRRTFGPVQRAGFVPAVDVDRDGSDVVITLELPGADEVNVEVADRKLSISGRRGSQRSEESGGVVVREIRSGDFRSEFALPEHVTADDVEADYADGLLKVRVHGVAKPKAEPRKIEVRGVKQVEGSTEQDES